MRFFGTKLQNFRVGRSQHLHCSSGSKKGLNQFIDVARGNIELLFDRMAAISFKGASGVAGFVFGNVITSDVNNWEEELLIKQKECIERYTESLRQLERKRQEWE